MKKIILIISVIATLTGCRTDNENAKYYGGTLVVQVPAGNKLVTATWKDTELWYLYRPARPGEKPEETTFKEKSTYGIYQGTVTFKESP